MPRLRSLALKRPWQVALLLVAALAMRVLVPAGFMPVFADGTVSLALCSGFGPLAETPAAVPIHGMMHGAQTEPGHTPDHDGDRMQSPCAFADLSLPVLGGADAILLAAMLAFAAVLALLRAPLFLAGAPVRRSPPSRGPPVLA